MLCTSHSTCPSHLLSNHRILAKQISKFRRSGLSDGEVENSEGANFDNEFEGELLEWTERVKTAIPHAEEDEMTLLRRVEQKLNGLEDKINERML